MVIYFLLHENRKLAMFSVENHIITRIKINYSMKAFLPLCVTDESSSMFYKSTYIPVDKALLNIDITSFYSKEVKLLKVVTNRGLLNLNLLPDDNYLYNLLSKDTQIKDEVNERLVKAYNKKKYYLEQYQNGANPWSYNYKG